MVMSLLLQILGACWLLGFVLLLALWCAWARKRNRRGGRLGRLLKCSHPEWN